MHRDFINRDDVDISTPEGRQAAAKLHCEVRQEQGHSSAHNIWLNETPDASQALEQGGSKALKSEEEIKPYNPPAH